jgi:anti-sigma regulatory factor (Ser/Thr protein kinase)
VEPFEASLPPDLSRLRRLRHDVAAWLDSIGVPPDRRDGVVLAVHEAAANAIEHATGRVTVRGAHDGEKLLLVVSNTGRWRGPRSVDVARGRGLTIMRALMNNLEIRTDSEGTTVRMRMDFPGRDTAPGAQISPK